jgi:hypothetical protein
LVGKLGIVGAASGLASFLQMIGAAGATAAFSLAGNGNPLVLALVIASTGLFAVTAFGSLAQFTRLPVKAARASVQCSDSYSSFTGMRWFSSSRRTPGPMCGMGTGLRRCGRNFDV